MSTAMVAEVAKKKPEPAPAPEEKGQKPMVVQIRGSQEWKAWVEGIAEKEGDTVAKLFERGIRKLAKEGGYPDPPKR